MFSSTYYGFWEFWAPYDPQAGYYGQQKVVFDGPNKKIYVVPDSGSISVKEDIYSNWKEWVQVRDHAKYEQAIRVSGGDPIADGTTTGDIYFLINGWQIIVDQNLDIYGVIFSDDFDSPFLREDGTNIVINRVSNLVQTLTPDTDLERSAQFGGRCIIDFEAIQTGADYPYGTWGRPVNNFEDAIQLSIKYGLEEFYVRNGTGSLATTMRGYTVSSSSRNNKIIIAASANIAGTTFQNITLEGSLNGQQVQGYNCQLNDITQFNGSFEQCALAGTLYPYNGANIVLAHCHSIIPGIQAPAVDFGTVTEACNVSVRGYNGGFRIVNMTSNSITGTFEIDAGRIRLEPSCTNGYLSIRGVAQVIDNSNGTVVDTTALVENLISTKLAPDFASVRQDIANVSVDVSTVGTDVTVLSGDVANVQTSVDQIGTDIATVQGDITQIGTDIATIQDTIDNAGFGGLTPAQANMLLEMYDLLGLDPTKPLIVTENSRTAGTISQTINTNSTSTTVTRNP